MVDFWRQIWKLEAWALGLGLFGLWFPGWGFSVGHFPNTMDYFRGSPLSTANSDPVSLPPPGGERGGVVLISRVFVVWFRCRPVNDFKRQMLSTRVPTWFPFNVFLRIGAKVANTLPLERKPFWRPLRSPKKGRKTMFKKHFNKNMQFCKKSLKLDFKWNPRGLIILTWVAPCATHGHQNHKMALKVVANVAKLC